MKCMKLLTKKLTKILFSTSVVLSLPLLSTISCSKNDNKDLSISKNATIAKDQINALNLGLSK